MRRLLFAFLLVALACNSGCTMYDMMFGVFGSHYSGGGVSRDDRESDYNERLRSYGAEQ
jgi:hypothetical protein